MLCRKKPSARRRRLRRWALKFLLLIIVLSLYLEFAVKIQLGDVISVGIKTAAQQAVNAAVQEVLDAEPGIGERLTLPRTGENGSVTAVVSDPAAINRLKAAVSELSQEKLEELTKKEGIGIPAGSFSGLFLFAELGPEIRLSVGCRANVACSLHSSLESAGVNQTLHHIILTVDAEAAVYHPFRIRRSICTSVDFEVAQTVIVGAVPEYTVGFR